MRSVLYFAVILVFGAILPFVIGRFIEPYSVSVILFIMSVCVGLLVNGITIDTYHKNNRNNNDFKLYRKKALQPMRPYILGEDLTGISVNKEDTPELGGMIARNPLNHEDQWYVAKKFFNDNYEQV
jgi:Co/Zn/Cd efflux system component